MAISKILYNGVTQMDLTQDSVAAENLLSGETAHGADGLAVTGSYAPSWTLLTTDEVTVSTSSTTSTAVKDVGYTFANAIDPRDYVFVITIVDKAGMRNGYFYCSTAFSVTASSSGLVGVQCFRYNDNTLIGYATSGTGGYGVFAREVSYGITKLTVKVYSRYNGTYSKTIDGTYKISVYSCAWPSGINPLK